MASSSPVPSPVDFPSPDFSLSGGYSPGPHSPGPALSPDFGPERDWRDYRERIPKIPSTRPRALTPAGFGDGDESQQRPAAAFQQSRWFEIPANLRRDILRLAFGDKRLHMHLNFDSQALDSDDPERKVWSWNGCVCVRKYGPDLGPMTRGGLNPGPWIDRCCDPINVPKPAPKNIGIMGWLQSCRQNYAETIDLLYLTNTIILSGEATITEFPSLITHEHLNRITSLHVKCPINNHNNMQVVLNHLSPGPHSPGFPNLKRLYISMEWNGFSTHDYSPDPWIASFDNFVREMHQLEECAVAIPMEYFSRISEPQIRSETTNKQISYSQFWRTLGSAEDGGGEGNELRGFEVIQLPYVDSYPKPPYHLHNSGAGYWILEACDMPLDHNYDDLNGDYSDFSV
ncbi:hypothetical protein NW762_005438 [Fusarium torreyae]|uniref:DUF7730 domain-containing protein n=1 Tax=Fusarium torreyae TaxID=1237075 RepID=A0A9W8VIL4_9HYPO|nr:hypothetical protein NW762_005438 [Fusarium torreyae]